MKKLFLDLKFKINNHKFLEGNSFIDLLLDLYCLGFLFFMPFIGIGFCCIFGFSLGFPLTLFALLLFFKFFNLH